jgi:hypothetical protein
MTIKSHKPVLKDIIFLLEREPENWEEMEIAALAYLTWVKGYKAQRSVTLKGVRGKHKIDVFAQTSKGGIIYKVIVECKCWNQKVKKQQVATLASIMDDVGASKGLIISRKGFQKGAIQYATLRSIDLIDLNKILYDLRCVILGLMEALFVHDLREFMEELKHAKRCSLDEVRDYLRDTKLLTEQIVHEHFNRYEKHLDTLEKAFFDLTDKISDWKAKTHKGEQNESPKSLWRELSSLRHRLKKLRESYAKPDYIL